MPDEFRPIAAFGIGAIIIVFLTLFHGVGLHWIQIQQIRGERRIRSGKPSVAAAAFLFGWSVFLMLDLHMLEVGIWAFALIRLGVIVRAYDAIYYCANCYTTLGMGNVDVGPHWRIITPIIGISGLFTFAWTTSALVDVVASNRRVLNQMEDEREQEMRMRLVMRKKQWEALKSERDAERAEKEKTKAMFHGASFFQKIRAWQYERKKVAELRKQNRAEMDDLFRQERLEERQTEAIDAASKPEDKEQQ
jgi:Ion channel